MSVGMYSAHEGILNYFLFMKSYSRVMHTFLPTVSVPNEQGRYVSRVLLLSPISISPVPVPHRSCKSSRVLRVCLASTAHHTDTAGVLQG